ncbi:MAG: mevalonate kinase [Thermoplasmata archaeon]
MVAASAPGKLILYGEHAVVFGEPALSVAISRRTRVDARPGARDEVNGHPLEEGRYPYVAEALRIMEVGEKLAVTIQSDIPVASGMGSSAAVTVGLLACLQGMGGPLQEEEIARTGFEVEHAVQGRASPIDTTTATHGGGILLLKEQEDHFLWAIEKGETRWNLHAAPLPEMTFVVGTTGIEAATGPLVAQVRKRVEAKEEALRAVTRIGEIALEGVEALRAGNLERGGELMLENHRLLNVLGVGHVALDKLVAASVPFSFGAKLTGAGGGGSMIALTTDPVAVAHALRNAGGIASVVSTVPTGVQLESES